MNRIGYRILWTSLILAVILSLVWQFAPLPAGSSRLAQLPASGLAFSSRDIPLNDVEKLVFSRAQTVKRLYQVGQQVFAVQAIDASGDRHAIHDPLYCFRGAGWEVASSRPIDVMAGQAQLLSLRRHDEKAEVVYWISDGRTRYTSQLKYRWQTACRRLTFGQSGPEPVLVLVQPDAGTSPDWSQLFSLFPGLMEL